QIVGQAGPHLSSTRAGPMTGAASGATAPAAAAHAAGTTWDTVHVVGPALWGRPDDHRSRLHDLEAVHDVAVSARERGGGVGLEHVDLPAQARAPEDDHFVGARVEGGDAVLIDRDRTG